MIIRAILILQVFQRMRCSPEQREDKNKEGKKLRGDEEIEGTLREQESRGSESIRGRSDTVEYPNQSQQH